MYFFHIFMVLCLNIATVNSIVNSKGNKILHTHSFFNIRHFHLTKNSQTQLQTLQKSSWTMTWALNTMPRGRLFHNIVDSWYLAAKILNEFQNLLGARHTSITIFLHLSIKCSDQDFSWGTYHGVLSIGKNQVT